MSAPTGLRAEAPPGARPATPPEATAAPPPSRARRAGQVLQGVLLGLLLLPALLGLAAIAGDVMAFRYQGY